MKTLKLVTIISLILSVSSMAGERLVGDWKPNVDKIKASKEYKAQGSPKWIDIFADMSATFTKEGDLIQYEDGKVKMKLKYKVLANKGDILHVAISAPGDDYQEYYIMTLSGKDEVTQVMSNKEFVSHKNDIPIIFSRIKK